MDMAGKSGGAWKVAYADFVTAMMAFFMVMWICSQDQKIKHAVAYYFEHPFGPTADGISKTPDTRGAFMTTPSTGKVPKEDSAANAAGHNVFTTDGERTPATNLVSGWIHGNRDAKQYWDTQAHRAYQNAYSARDVKLGRVPAHECATLELAQQLRREITSEQKKQPGGLFSDLLQGALAEVNWNQLAEDIIATCPAPAETPAVRR
jgi:flagellar motor protein MotB